MTALVYVSSTNLLTLFVKDMFHFSYLLRFSSKKHSSCFCDMEVLGLHHFASTVFEQVAW